MNLITSRLYSIQLILRQHIISRVYKSKSRSAVVGNDGLNPQKILFVLSGLLGDSVMSLPAITESRKIWPKANIKVLGRSHNRDLLLADKDIDEFYVCSADPFSIRKSTEIKKLQSWLSEQKFDLAIILLGDQYAHLLAKAGIPIRVGVEGTILEPCLTHTYNIGSPREWGTNERLNSLRVLGYDLRPDVPKLKVNDGSAITANQKLEALGINIDEEFVLLHPFGSTRRQWWSLANINQFADNIFRQDKLPTVLIGGQETVDEIEYEYPVIDTRAKFDIPELLAVISRAKTVVTTDSGPYHIAGALHRPIVGLFRDRRPEHASAYQNVKIVFGKNQQCDLQCLWDKCDTDPCRQMNDVSLKQVMSHF